MTTQPFKRNIFQRLFGIPATQPPADAGCWTISDNQIIIDLNRAQELTHPWGAIQIDGESMPQKVLVFQDGNGIYRAFHNKCEHIGRKLDPVPGSETLQCCSIGRSTFDYDGNVLSGLSDKPIKAYPVVTDGDRLIIQI